METKEKHGMTLPNKLTLIRILIIPIMIVLFYIPVLRENIFSSNSGLSYLYFIEFILFAIASFTDFLDGHIARKYNLVTTFGKFLDPLADKLLVFTAMAMFMADNVNLNGIELMPLWVFMIMLIREFGVSGIRMLASSKGEVIAAGKMGKLKTLVTMVGLCISFFVGLHQVIFWISYVLIMLSCLLTILSGIEYFYNSRKIIFESF